MESNSQFIFEIDAERHYNVLVRITGVLNRQRIPIAGFNSTHQGEDLLRIRLSVAMQKETAVKLSRRLCREVDIISVNIFEQLNP